MVAGKPEQVFDNVPVADNNRGSNGRGRYDERLNRILQAGASEFARAGYHVTAMRTLAKAANVSLAGLYHYFENKEKILFLIQFRTFNSLLNNLCEKLHGVDDPIEQLRIMVLAHVMYFAQNMAEQKVCSHEMDSVSGEAFTEIHRIRRDYYKRT